jgi:CRISP-associated protein Cas1
MEAGIVENTAFTAEVWPHRCVHWQLHSAGTTQPLKRRRAVSPIVLCGHGISLRINKGALLIRDGLTHYPQERAETQIFPGDPTRPTRIIVMDGSGSITFDAIDWLREQDIALIRIDWTGAASVISGAGYAADPVAWRRQETLRADPLRRMAIARHLILHKLERSIETLQRHVPPSPNHARAIAVIGEKRSLVRDRRRLTTQDLYGAEGRAAKVYFDAWAGTPLTWTGTRRRPVPEAWRSIGQRQSFATGKRGKNYNATHPLNAMLNYAYALLEAHVRLDVVAAGYDPLRGFLHVGGRRAPALVLDLMEPLRPVVDGGVLEFAQKETFAAADFTLRSDGVCRLNPQLARRVAQLTADTLRNAPSPLAPLQR